jgi:signal peptidase II
MFYLAALIIFILDQTTKQIIAITMRPSQTIPLIKNILHLTYVQNRGAAFGLFYGKLWFLITTGIILTILMIYYYFRSQKSYWMQIPLGFIVGGSLGNISDRIFRRYVVDFIDFRIPYGPYGWPVFNFADTIINIGVFLIVIRLMFYKEKEDAPGSA